MRIYFEAKFDAVSDSKTTDAGIRRECKTFAGIVECGFLEESLKLILLPKDTINSDVLGKGESSEESSNSSKSISSSLTLLLR